MGGGERTEPGSRGRARTASAVVPLPQHATGDRLDLARLVPSGRSLLVGFALVAGVFAPYLGARACVPGARRAPGGRRRGRQRLDPRDSQDGATSRARAPAPLASAEGRR